MKEKKNRKDIDLAALAQGRVTAKGKPKRNIRLIVVNTICSLTLVASILALSGILFLGARPFALGGEAVIPEDIIPSPSMNQSNILITGYDMEENLADIIMVVSMDLQNNKASILQIPRDTYVDAKEGRITGSSKINASYSQAKAGTSKFGAMMKMVNQNFGMPLDGYVGITIEGFRRIVDAVGGVDIEITSPSGLTLEIWEGGQRNVHLEQGMVHLNGAYAEGIMRKRKGKTAEGYGSGSDINRAKMQRSFYAALMRKLMDVTPSQLFTLVRTCYSQINSSFSVNEMLGYAKKLKELEMSDIDIYTLPGQGVMAKTTTLGQNISLYSIHLNEYIELYNTRLRHHNDPITEAQVRAREIFKVKTADEAAPGGTLDEVSGIGPKPKTNSGG